MGIKINLAKSAGFCFGVKRALDIAFETVKSGQSVYMLGDIVHNEDVVKQIKNAGIKKIKKLGFGKNKILLIHAHGTCQNILTKAKKLGYKIINATCPMVKEIHKIAKNMEQNGYSVIVIGDKIHDEVHGITGQLQKKALVIDNPKNMHLKKIKKIKKACIVVQSTQNLEKVLKIVYILKSHIPKLKFFNTICRPTRIKQEEIKTMSLKNDVMIIIGSKNSANTKRLYEISKSLNKNTYWIQSKNNLNYKWFRNAKCVGITSGASTPETTTKEVVNCIKQKT